MALPRHKCGFTIEVGCPGCGGDLELQENFFVLNCRHCGTPLRVRQPDSPPVYLIKSKLKPHEIRFHADRYLRSNYLPLTESGAAVKSLYYPYWDIDALILKQRNKKIERFVSCDEYDNSEDRSFEQEKTEISLAPYAVSLSAGQELYGIPATLGLRTGYLKAIPFAPEKVDDGFDTLPILVSWPDITENVRKKIRAVGNIQMADFGSNRTELLSITGSLVYFPFYILETYGHEGFCRLVLDGVTGRACGHQTELDTPEVLADVKPAAFEFTALKVELHRCQNCGEDLPITQSFIYVCKNCSVATSLAFSGDSNIELLKVVSDERTDTQLFPFWILGSNQREVVVPAFRIANFEALFRLSKRMTTAITKLDLESVDTPDERFQPVAIDLPEASALARAVMFRECAATKNWNNCIADNTVYSGIKLAYAPFRPEHYFYVDTILGAVTFEKSAVS
jgi:hypothetical protein